MNARQQCFILAEKLFAEANQEEAVGGEAANHTKAN